MGEVAIVQAVVWSIVCIRRLHIITSQRVTSRLLTYNTHNPFNIIDPYKP